MNLSRSAGILLHPTSLPGPEGIGTLGPEARQFADTLDSARMRLWQTLPLVPPDSWSSPYAGLSAFAGNPLLISTEVLSQAGLRTDEDASNLLEESTDRVDFAAVAPAKMAVLRRAFDRMKGREDAALSAFRRVNVHWLDDFALFMAVREDHDGAPWHEWEESLRTRDDRALDQARARLHDDIAFHVWAQFQFFQQWSSLRDHVHSREIRLVGDIPIFVAYDSADVWAHRELFRLDSNGAPTVVSGVPPDLFTETGQLWGTPHYNWEVMAEEGFRWWIDRFRMAFALADIVRIDHFRGFAAAWEVPYGSTTAQRGVWQPAPGAALFAAVESALGKLPIIAEDLGVITPEVDALRKQFGFPSMKVLQFAFGSGPSNEHLPHNYVRDTVVYTGTHDNETTAGWFANLGEKERRAVLAYTGTEGRDPSWELMRLAFASVAQMALAPLQDVLRLGNEARMNSPGTASGNWAWRCLPDSITEDHIRDLRALAETYGRAGEAGS